MQSRLSQMHALRVETMKIRIRTYRVLKQKLRHIEFLPARYFGLGLHLFHKPRLQALSFTIESTQTHSG